MHDFKIWIRCAKWSSRMWSFQVKLMKFKLGVSNGPFNLQPLFWKSVEKWFRVWRTIFLQPEKRWICSINPPVFLVNHFSRTRKKNLSLQNHFSWTRFLEPDFSNQISKNCKNGGRRIKVRVYNCWWPNCPTYTNWPQAIYNPHYSNGAPAMSTS